MSPRPRAIRAGLSFLLACAASLAASGATAAPPVRGVLVPGNSLAGVRIGMTKAQVLRAWGPRHGVCRGCPRTTWYFNFRRFEPQGAGVVFLRERVAQVYTVWRPMGWRTPAGLTLGAEEARVREAYPGLKEQACDDYTALVSTGRSADTVFYVYREKLWGFGLMGRAGFRPPRASPCL